MLIDKQTFVKSRLQIVDNLIENEKYMNTSNTTKIIQDNIYISIYYIPKLTDQRSLDPLFGNKVKLKYKPYQSLNGLFKKNKGRYGQNQTIQR